MATTYTPQIQDFAVRVHDAALFCYPNTTYTYALKQAGRLRRDGVTAEVVARMTHIGTYDVPGALLYDGSTWVEDDWGYIRPAVVNGITYYEVAA